MSNEFRVVHRLHGGSRIESLPFTSFELALAWMAEIKPDKVPVYRGWSQREDSTELECIFIEGRAVSDWGMV